MKRFIRDYLTFSRRDRIGILTLVFLIILVYSIPYFMPKPGGFPIKADPALVKALDTIAARDTFKDSAWQKNKGRYSKKVISNGFTEGELFAFDPNSLSIEGWGKLGLNARIAQTIENYRNKGGKFYKPEDLQKIWGMPDGFYQRVKSYISIPASHTTLAYQSPSREKHFDSKPLDIDINLADTNSFIALPGIGSKLANRIIKFRNQLGGFYSVDQIEETYGLPDSTFQKIKQHLHMGEPKLKMVNINAATKEELKAHPYIKWNLANAIVEYRNQHGPYLQLDDLKKISIVTNDLYNKLLPYLSLQ